MSEPRPDYHELVQALRDLPDYRLVGHYAYEEFYKRIVIPLLERCPEP